MSRSLKGELGEEVFAVIFIIALIFVFIMSVLGAYTNYLNMQETISSGRIASELAESMFFSNQGIITEEACQSLNRTYGNLSNVRIDILYRQENGLKNCSAGSVAEGDQAVASMPLLIAADGKYYPGKVRVHVGTG
ncbi:MAG: hypothetical protein QXU82_00030 [Candidatus Aenigmatarchaeota archaeon]